VHVRGDMAGQAIIAALTQAVRHTPSVNVIEGFVAEALSTADATVTGVQLRKADDVTARPLTMAASAVVLATGGIGHLYAVTTNPAQASGLGLAIAARAGAAIADPEFVQFHPTAIMVGRDPAPLATEALRGEGATLINARGERFMQAHHPLAELAPRDIVARGVFAEIFANRGAFLDARVALGGRFAEKFPTVHASCLAGGIDPAKAPIPIAPAAHYHMGGILVDAHGRSSIDGLWAAGEVAATGAHGGQSAGVELAVGSGGVCRQGCGRDRWPTATLACGCACRGAAAAQWRVPCGRRKDVARDDELACRRHQDWRAACGRHTSVRGG
jgi:L-aspartate oxidase